MKAALIGAGQIARQHLGCLQRLPGVEVAAVCDLSPATAECAAEPAVTVAVIRFAVAFPGTSTPKVSWVILPIAPTGVMSVSPVARHATMARKKDMITARIPIHQWMPKNHIWRTTAARPVVGPFEAPGNSSMMDFSSAVRPASNNPTRAISRKATVKSPA